MRTDGQYRPGFLCTLLLKDFAPSNGPLDKELERRGPAGVFAR
jgi:hypothetical protein